MARYRVCVTLIIDAENETIAACSADAIARNVSEVWCESDDSAIGEVLGREDDTDGDGNDG